MLINISWCYINHDNSIMNSLRLDYKTFISTDCSVNSLNESLTIYIVLLTINC